MGTAASEGTAVLNIRASRLGGSTERSQNPQDNGGSMSDGTWKGGITGSTLGRWPANLILQHKENCVLEGSPFADFEPLCEQGCPCRELDEQTGTLTTGDRTGKRKSPKTSTVFREFKPQDEEPSIGDSGGASRYYKQIHSLSELHEYLRVLISPPAPYKPAVVLAGSPEALRGPYAGSITGLVVSGLSPTEARAEALYALLKPGAHLCLVSSDDQPTGHTGVCLMEDAGFEVRDAILWVRDASCLHYVAKANRAEREAGCQSLPSKKGHEAVERKEGSAGMANPRAGAGRTAKEVYNHHPCLHPMARVMARYGMERISSLQVGEQVLAADGRFHTIEAVSHHRYTSQFLYRVEAFGFETPVEASDNHPFLIWRFDDGASWVAAKDIRVGDYTMTPIITPGETSQYSPDLWWAYGLWLADADTYKGGLRFRLRHNQTEEADKLRKILGSTFEEKSEDQALYFQDKDVERAQLFLKWSSELFQVLPDFFWEESYACWESLFGGFSVGAFGEGDDAGTTTSDILHRRLSSQLRHVAGTLGYRPFFEKRPTDIKVCGEYTYIFGRAPKAPSELQTYHEGVRYNLSKVTAVTPVPYEGDVWNLSVEGSPTFQTSVGMSHNTVKPVKVMTRLLRDVPMELGPVYDFFMGSGTTMVSCLETGHDAVGIDEREDYVRIAEARARYWDKAKKGWLGAEITSELGPKEDHPDDPKEIDLLDLFG